MNYDDYVAVELGDGKHGSVVSADYAKAFDLKVLKDEPLIAHGRLRGVFRLDGRPTKPKASLPKAIPTPKTSSEPAGGEPDGVAVEKNIKES